MAIFSLKPGDISAFKLLFLLAIMYGLMSVLVYSVLHMKFVKPLGIDAPLDRFSEARAIEHIRVLTKDIVGRHEGRPGLKQAADYIKSELELLKDRANSNYRIEVEESMVNGSFNMMFLGHSISLTYRAHTNVLMRLSSVNSTKIDASVLVNGHFDSALNSPGAGDCGSCVASMLELARLLVDSGWNPPRPIIFLFNGAEELFMLGSHGFITTHRWRDTVGAFINIEASGSGGPDVVCQSGPGSWPAKVYSQSAVYPMAQSSAQDVFGVIPGDTDYRILAQDYGNIPGLDVIFLLGGYFYHTSYDTLERLLPGSIQARGDNLFSVVKAFASSSMLRNTSERQSFESSAGNTSEERAIFFDYMTWFMVYYPKSISAVLHILPIVIFLVVPIFLQPPYFGLRSCCKIYFDFLKGMLQHFIASIMAIVVSVTFAVLRLLCSGHAMNWFANPYLAFMMFVPCSVVGLLIPRYVSRCFRLFQDESVQKVLAEAQFDEAGFFGAFGFYALLSMVYFLAGLGGGYLTFFVSVSMLLAWLSNQLLSYRNHSLRSVLVYTFPLLPCLTYSVHFSGFIMQFLIEKMGMIGSIPPPYGYYLQDVVVAAMVGVVTGWCLGPLLPVIGDWLARSSIMQALVQLSVLALALSSGFFPYSVDAPKRVVMQHTIVTTDSMQILGSSYDFTVVDSNSLSFLFKHAWNASEDLKIGPGSFEPTRDKWLAIFPVSFLLSKSLKFPVKHEDFLKQYNSFPHLSRVDHEEFSDARVRKVHLELTLGSLKEVWVTVLNVTGPLSRWSFADQTLPAPETIDGGPLSYICRLSGASNEKWAFWLEANSTEPLRVEVAVLDQYMVQEAKELKLRFPDWVDVVAYTSFEIELVERLCSAATSATDGFVKGEEVEEVKTEKQVKATKKGSAVLDQWLPDNIKSQYHVLEKEDGIYDAMLNQTNVGDNNNKFYVIQVLEIDGGGTYMVYSRWGRVGVKGQDKLFGPYSCQETAIQEFQQKFLAKTKNHWSDRKNFVSYPKSYTWLEMDYSEKEQDKEKLPSTSTSIQPRETKLEPRVAKFISLICNISMMKQQMMEIGYNAEKLPLGKLSKSTILKGYNVLKRISDALGQSNKKLLEQLSGEFYTVIPHDFGYKKMREFVIDTPQKLKRKLEMVEALGEIELATKLLSEDVGMQFDLLFSQYGRLHCELIPVEVDSEEFSMIQQYTKNTHAKTHSNYTVKITQIFRVSREGEDERFKKFSNTKNRMLLWHGSRLTNWTGILSQGLRIAPPEAPATGYMFGKGVYFADMFSKSANYCCSSSGAPTGVLLLCEVALGEMEELHYANYNADKLPSGKLSTKGVGATAPNMSQSKVLDDGVVVPFGKPVEKKESKVSLLYNEYIVYNVDQIRMRYVVQVNFKYVS